MRLLLRTAALAAACLMTGPLSAAESPGLAERIAGLEPFIGAYPPSFAIKASEISKFA